MSATGEVESPAVEKVPEEAPAAEQPLAPAEKAVKEKKPRAAKEKKARTRKTVSHPPYFQMIEEALVALNEKSGSSPYAIAKFVEEKHKAVLPLNFKKMLGLQLKNAAAKGKLVKIKASYKLSEPAKKSKGAAKAEKKPERRVTRRKTEQQKVVAKKKKKAAPKRKSVAAIAKPKQPKSIKVPAKKKPNRATA